MSDISDTADTSQGPDLAAIALAVRWPPVDPQDDARAALAAHGLGPAYGRLRRARRVVGRRPRRRPRRPARTRGRRGRDQPAARHREGGRPATPVAPGGHPAGRGPCLGIETADALADEGTDLLLVAADDPPARRVLAAALLDLGRFDALGWPQPEDGTRDPERTGPSTTRAWMDEATALRDGLRRVRADEEHPVALLRALGSPVLAAATGLLLQATARRTPVLLDGPGAAAAGLFVRGQAWEAPDWWQVAERPADALHDRTVAGLRLTPLPGPAVAVEDGTGPCSPPTSWPPPRPCWRPSPCRRPPRRNRCPSSTRCPTTRCSTPRPRDPVPLRDGLLLAVGTLTVVRVPPPRQVDAARAGLAMTVAPSSGRCSRCPRRPSPAWRSPPAPARWSRPPWRSGPSPGVQASSHLDGLADTVDGVAAGRGDRARSLEVMRQGQVQPLGAATLGVACSSCRWRRSRAACPLPATPAEALGCPRAARRGRGRAAALPLLSAGGCPRRAPAGSAPAWPGRCPTGRARGAARGGRARGARRRAGAGGPAAPARCGSRRRCWGCLVGVLLAARAARRIGGVTGDVLGAGVECGDDAALVLLATG